jgi:hypothetical protein
MDLEEAKQRRMIDGLSETGAAADDDLDRKFWIAMALFAVLALLAWFTIDGSVMVMGKPVEIRLVPVIVIGGLALRTVLARQAEKIRRASERDS